MNWISSTRSTSALRYFFLKGRVSFSLMAEISSFVNTSPVTYTIFVSGSEALIALDMAVSR